MHMRMAYTSENDLLCDVLVMWGGISRVHTTIAPNYNTIGKLLGQIKAVPAGTSGIVTITLPNDEGVVSVILEIPNDYDSFESPFINNI